MAKTTSTAADRSKMELAVAHAERCWEAESDNAARLTGRNKFQLGFLIVLLGYSAYTLLTIAMQWQLLPGESHWKDRFTCFLFSLALLCFLAAIWRALFNVDLPNTWKTRRNKLTNIFENLMMAAADRKHKWIPFDPAAEAGEDPADNCVFASELLQLNPEEFITKRVAETKMNVMIYESLQTATARLAATNAATNSRLMVSTSWTFFGVILAVLSLVLHSLF